MTLRFEKKDGNTPSDRIMAFVSREVERLKDGKWQVSIEKPQRTNDQNRLFWYWIRMLSYETGNDERELYQYFSERYNPQGCTYKRDGTFASGGTSDLNTKDYSLLLDQMQADVAAEQGIKLPTMDDLRIESLITNK
jgi:hypothetical protein